MVDLRFRNTVVVGALFFCVGVSFAIPFYLSASTSTVDSTGRLHDAATRRGAYLNTGSKDIGPEKRF